jgi:hypothetical protein
MEKNPSSKALSSSARQEIPRILLSPKVHYPVLKNPRRVSVVRQIQSTPFQPISLRFTLILSSHLRLGPIVSFLHISSLPYVPHDPPIILFDSVIPGSTWLEAHILKFLNVHFPSVRCYLIPIRPKHTSHQPILENTKPTFFPLRGRPNFTLI